MRYLLEHNKPFRGIICSILLDDGTVAYTDGLTLAEYQKERGKVYDILTDDALDLLMAEWTKAQITEPVEETEAQYWYALEVMPPSKWRTVRGVNLFHICERIQFDLVNWHAQLNGRYFTFVDQSTADMDALAAKVAGAAKGTPMMEDRG